MSTLPYEPATAEPIREPVVRQQDGVWVLELPPAPTWRKVLVTLPGTVFGALLAGAGAWGVWHFSGSDASLWCAGIPGIGGAVLLFSGAIDLARFLRLPRRATVVWIGPAGLAIESYRSGKLRRFEYAAGEIVAIDIDLRVSAASLGCVVRLQVYSPGGRRTGYRFDTSSISFVKALSAAAWLHYPRGGSGWLWRRLIPSTGEVWV